MIRLNKTTENSLYLSFIIYHPTLSLNIHALPCYQNKDQSIQIQYKPSSHPPFWIRTAHNNKLNSKTKFYSLICIATVHFNILNSQPLHSFTSLQ